MFNFLHTTIPNKTLLDLGPVSIHWYGVLISIGAVIGFLTVIKLAKKYGIEKTKIYDMGFWIIIVGLIFDRLYYVIYAWEYYSRNLIDIFKIWEGGLAIYGGMVGGLLVLYIYSKKLKRSFANLVDIFVPALAIGLAFGRWGNYFNQELFGLPTSLPWGLPIVPQLRPEEFLSSQYFHPTFLYESLAMFLLFALLLIIHKVQLSHEKRHAGVVATIFFLIYAIERFFMESLRLDYSPYVFGMRINQFISVVIVIAVVGVLVGVKIKHIKEQKKKVH